VEAKSAPASFGTAPASFGTAPASFGTAPASFGAAPASFGAAPASFGAAPASFGTAPARVVAGFEIRPLPLRAPVLVPRAWALLLRAPVPHELRRRSLRLWVATSAPALLIQCGALHSGSFRVASGFMVRRKIDHFRTLASNARHSRPRLISTRWVRRTLLKITSHPVDPERKPPRDH